MTSVKKSPEENVKIKQQIHTDQYPPKKKSTFANAEETDMHVSVLPSCAEYA